MTRREALTMAAAALITAAGTHVFLFADLPALTPSPAQIPAPVDVPLSDLRSDDGARPATEVADDRTPTRSRGAEDVDCDD